MSRSSKRARLSSGAQQHSSPSSPPPATITTRSGRTVKSTANLVALLNQKENDDNYEEYQQPQHIKAETSSTRTINNHRISSSSRSNTHTRTSNSSTNEADQAERSERPDSASDSDDDALLVAAETADPPEEDSAQRETQDSKNTPHSSLTSLSVSRRSSRRKTASSNTDSTPDVTARAYDDEAVDLEDEPSTADSDRLLAERLAAEEELQSDYDRRYPRRTRKPAENFSELQAKTIEQSYRPRNTSINHTANRGNDREYEVLYEDVYEPCRPQYVKEAGIVLEEGLEVSLRSDRYALRRRMVSDNIYSDTHGNSNNNNNTTTDNTIDVNGSEFNENGVRRYSLRQRSEIPRVQPTNLGHPAPSVRSQYSNSNSNSHHPSHAHNNYSSNHNNPYHRSRRVSGTGGSHSRRSYTHRHSSAHRAHSESDSSDSHSSDSTETEFIKKEQRRMMNERNKIKPMNLVMDPVHGLQMPNQSNNNNNSSTSSSNVAQNKKNKKSNLADIDPILVDNSLNWDMLGGLENHISSLKEMVVLPLLYPEVFAKFAIQPPRGVLFAGAPGCGKTALARVLAAQCSQASGKKVAFFMRKGADCLSKWVGEAERQLRLLFEQAQKLQPSIIFFDEIDGLCPVRSSKQDQIHSSIVSTLLALMDGLDDRGQVIVIGATNRIDSIDPALRRPGRFDRELMFQLPAKQARRDILAIHTRTWKDQISSEFLNSVADECVGYCGADLKALCTEAALAAVKRTYPQIYQNTNKLVLDPSQIKMKPVDFIVAKKSITPASQRSSIVFARALPDNLAPILGKQLEEIVHQISLFFPLAAQTKSEQAAKGNVILDYQHQQTDNNSNSNSNSNSSDSKTDTSTNFTHIISVPPPSPVLPLRPRILLHGAFGLGQNHLGAAVVQHFEQFSMYSIDLPTLYSDINSSSIEENLTRIVSESRRTSPSILYWPNADQWLRTASHGVCSLLIQLLSDIHSDQPVLLLATVSSKWCELSRTEVLNIHGDTPIFGPISTLSSIFAPRCSYFYECTPPTQAQRSQFLYSIQLEATRPPPQIIDLKSTDLPKLPVAATMSTSDTTNFISASTPAASSAASPDDNSTLSVTEIQARNHQEEILLRTLRVFLRGVIDNLVRNFRDFADPIDPEELPAYSSVVSQPICLYEMLDKNNSDKYDSIKSFLLDVDLLVDNTRRYFGRAEFGTRGIALVNRACHLQDMALNFVCQFDLAVAAKCESIHQRRVKERARNRDKMEKEMREENNRSKKRTSSSNNNAEICEDEILLTTTADTAASMDDAAQSEESSEETTKPESSDSAYSNPVSTDVFPLRAESAPPADVSMADSSSSMGVDPSIVAPAFIPASATEPEPPRKVSIDHSLLQSVLAEAISRTSSSSVDDLERIHFELAKLIFHAQHNWERTALVKDMQKFLRTLQ